MFQFEKKAMRDMHFAHCFRLKEVDTRNYCKSIIFRITHQFQHDILLIISASFAGEDRIHTCEYVQSYIKDIRGRIKT